MAENESVARLNHAVQFFDGEWDAECLCLAGRTAIEQGCHRFFHCTIPPHCQQRMIALYLPAMVGFGQIASGTAGFQFEQALASRLLPEDIQPSPKADFRG